MAKVKSTMLALVVGSACGEPLSPPDYVPTHGIASFFIDHHASPVDGAFPEHATPLVFQTNAGWTVTLELAYLNTQSMELVGCDGYTGSIDVYWGAYPEDLTTPGPDYSPFGGSHVTAGEYCAVRVNYGPHFTGSADDFPTPHEDFVGLTIWIEGQAERDGEELPISLQIASPFNHDLALADEERELLRNDNDRPDITVSKAWDRLFDDVDFATTDQAALEDTVQSKLEAHTYLWVNRGVSPY